jgi:hopene-associated glycosyltransferase HpnB
MPGLRRVMTVCEAAMVTFLVAACVLAAVAWVYLLVAHGGYWRTDCRLPAVAGSPDVGLLVLGPAGPAVVPVPDTPGLASPRQVSPANQGAETAPPRWPGVVAVVPARDEAAILPETLPTLLGQDYPGDFSVVLVDDGSTDGTGAVAARLGRGHPLRVVPGSPPPDGWAGKVWAMATGVAAAGECDYLLFTDADIAFALGALTRLVRAAVADDRALVSQMALLRAETAWERWIVPAFVYFFAKLYPFRRVGQPRSRTAAAAGGCMLVHRQTLAAAGGLERIRGARIDDVALGRLLKRGPVQARCWLGWTSHVHSRRPYPRLAELWDMVARSAYTQLRYSPAMLVGTVVGLAWLYLLPPLAALGGLAALAAGAGTVAAGLFVAGLAGWAIMTATYLPVLRLYRLSPLRAPALPVIALLYAAMTVDSARRHRAGRGGEWKGRAITAAGRAR